MRKLNKRKVRWIVREMKKGELSSYQIAKSLKITKEWVYKIYNKYKDKDLYKGFVITFNKPGKKERPISKEEIELIMAVRKANTYGAVSIERLLKQAKKRMSHNRIHKVLLHLDLANKEPKKSKRRKWIRYERKHTNSLWHTDWLEYKGKQIIAYEDDASRFITGFGVFERATAENSAAVLKKAVAECGKPKQIMSDHGIQFTSVPRENCEDPGPNLFQKTLTELGIEHIKARVKHPQSNGKVERLFGTLKKEFDFRDSWDKAVEYYNFSRIHMSLDVGERVRTPWQAFEEKKSKS